MAEITGLVMGGVGLAFLFNNCIECLKMVQMGKAKTHDLEILHQKLENQKARFQAWGESVWLDDDTRECLLEFSPVVRNSVGNIMKLVAKLFSESEILTAKYGLQPDNAQSQKLRKRDYAASPFKEVFQRMQKRTKTSSTAEGTSSGSTFIWVIRDREQFLELINVLSGLIDDLESITNSAANIARRRKIYQDYIEFVPENSLPIVEEAGEDSNDPLSEAASMRMELLSNATSSEIRSHSTFWTAQSYFSASSTRHRLGNLPSDQQVDEILGEASSSTRNSALAAVSNGYFASNEHDPEDFNKELSKDRTGAKYNDSNFSQAKFVLETTSVSCAQELGSPVRSLLERFREHQHPHDMLSFRQTETMSIQLRSLFLAFRTQRFVHQHRFYTSYNTILNKEGDYRDLEGLEATFCRISHNPPPRLLAAVTKGAMDKQNSSVVFFGLDLEVTSRTGRCWEDSQIPAAAYMLDPRENGPSWHRGSLYYEQADMICEKKSILDLLLDIRARMISNGPTDPSCRCEVRSDEEVESFLERLAAVTLE